VSPSVQPKRGSHYSVHVEDECQLADICGVLIGHRVTFTVEPGEGRSFLVSLLPEGADLITEMYGPMRTP
jgi:hypothetical protein